MKISRYSLNASLTTHWMVGGGFFKPNGVTIHSNVPQFL
jgi:hypothetical protein